MTVELCNITMDFPGTRALDNVSAEFRFDEVNGIIGENGAGKSTFVNILAGSLVSSEGVVKIDGQELRISSPREALSHGIAHVSQEGCLVDSLSGAENILLGNEPISILGIVNRKKLLKRAKALLASWFPKVEIDLAKPVAELAVADRKVIEIVRALRSDIKLVVLDEPTAALQFREKLQLWDIIRSLPKRGIGVVLISHFLSEIKSLSDRITVLRDGKHVATIDAQEASEGELVNLMLRRADGAKGVGVKQKPKGNIGKPVLSVSNFNVGNLSVEEFTLNAGEVVGLIGLTGAGHFGFARSIYTRKGVTSGEVKVNGIAVQSPTIRAMQRRGVAFIPDHRMENALSADGNIVENMSMVYPEYSSISGTGILRLSKERKETARIIESLNIKVANQNQLLRNLSGGNKQKVSLGKWLFGAEGRYSVMIFIEPTEGVDIGAKQEIYSLMRRLADQGMGILIASSDLLEIEYITDRVIPFVEGQMGMEIASNKFSEERFIKAMAGETHGN